MESIHRSVAIPLAFLRPLAPSCCRCPSFNRWQFMWMLDYSRHDIDLKRLQERLHRADSVTREPLLDVVAKACPR